MPAKTRSSATHDLIVSGATVAVTAAAEGERRTRLSIVGYTGGVVRPFGLGRAAVFSIAGIELPDTIPLLAEHDASLSGIAGQGRAEARNGEIAVSAELADTPKGREIAELANAGIALQASIGLEPKQQRMIRAGQRVRVNNRTITAPEGGLIVLDESVMREISIVAIGADRDTSVSIAAAAHTQGGSTMGFEDWLAAQGWQKDELSDGQVASLRAAYDAEMGGAGGGGFDADTASELIAAADGNTAIAQQAIRERWTVDQTKLAALRASRPTAGGATGTAGYASATRPADMIAAAAMIACGMESAAEQAYGAQTAQRAADYGCSSSMDLCRAALAAEHRDVPSDRGEMIRAAFSTTSLPTALGDSAEKAAQVAYREITPTWRSWAARKSVRNFKVATSIRPWLKDGQFERVGNGGELKHASPNEEAFAHKADTLGRLFYVTRQTVVDDDLGMIFELAAELGRQGRRILSDLAYATLMGNMDRAGDTFFSTGNGNYKTGATTALSFSALSAAVANMRGKVDENGKPIDVPIASLVVPPSLETAARALLNSTEINPGGGDTTPTANPFKDLARLEVEPRLENAEFAGSSSKAWYLIGNPSAAPVLVMSFLNGREGVTMEQVAPPADTLGVGFRAYIDAGADLADPRGGYKAKGEA